MPTVPCHWARVHALKHDPSNLDPVRLAWQVTLYAINCPIASPLVLSTRLNARRNSRTALSLGHLGSFEELFDDQRETRIRDGPNILDYRYLRVSQYSYAL